MESSLAFLLILTTAAFAPDYVCSQSLNVSQNPVPVGNDITFYGPAPVTTGAWLFNNEIIVVIYPGGHILSNAWSSRVIFNSSMSSLMIKSVQLNDSGDYTLEELNSFRVKLTLSVQEPVSNVTVKANATALVEFNDTAVFMCSVSSGSSLSFAWLQGHDELTDGGRVELSNGNATLTVRSVTRDDEGPFKCSVSNGVSHEMSAPLYLNISYGPSNTTLMISPMVPDYIYRTGTNITVRCWATSSPAAVIKWMFNDKYMNQYNGPYIDLVNVTESNSGNYTCVSHNTVTSRFSSATMSLWVLDPLERVEVNHTGGPAIFNGTFTLHCEVTGSVDRIQWWRNGHLIHPNDTIVFDMSNTSMTIDPVQHSDDGYYQCQAFNAVSEMTSSSYHVKVIYGPEMPIITGPTKAKTGSSVTFHCKASSYPPSHYTWHFNGTLVASTPVYETPPLTKNMSGMYTCKAYNNVTGQNSTAYTMLTVVDPIEDVRIEASEKPPIEGKLYELYCNVTGPADYVYWMKNGMKLHRHNTTFCSMDNKTLTFKPLTRYDTGNYSCKAMNAVGNMTSALYRLLVNFGPEALHIYGPEFAETGKSVNFSCSAMSQPPSHFTWLFNGTEVSSTSTFKTDLLTLNMSGEYTCEAYNNVTGKKSSDSKELTVIEAIKSVMIKNKTLPINTNNFTLICEVDGPYDMIYWSKNGQRLNMNTSDSDMHYHIKDNLLHFTPVTLGSEGKYECEAANRAAEHSSPKYTLLVMYGPLHVNITGPDRETQGVGVSLTCSADSRPECDFYWFFNETSEPANSGSVFTFTAGKKTEGTYTCMATNRVTKISVSKTKSFSLNASAFHPPSQGNLMVMGVFALFVPVMFK